MNWIRQERAERRKPNMEKLQCAWDQAQTQNPADELLNVPLDPKNGDRQFRTSLAALPKL
jgi:hypothetical protein